MKSGDWTAEYLADGEVHRHQVEKMVFALEGRHQTIEVLDTKSYGRGLFLDGRLQHLEADEYIYSEGIVHPVATMLGRHCRKVLVVGGGPGGAIRELLKHNVIESITQVEIDESIIELASKYFSHISKGCYDNNKVKVIISDIKDYLSVCGTLYDFIIYDVSEPYPNSPADGLFAISTLRSMRDRLSNKGVFITWAGSAGPRSNALSTEIVSRVRAVFECVSVYVSHPQSYGTSWLSVIGSGNPLSPLKWKPRDIDNIIERQVVGTLRLYDGVTHQHMFSVPKDIRMALSSANRFEQEGPLRLMRSKAAEQS